jgi:hypothetical protein
VNENILLRAKKEAMDSHQRIEQLYGEALQAMRRYAGQPSSPAYEVEGDVDDDFG